MMRTTYKLTILCTGLLMLLTAWSFAEQEGRLDINVRQVYNEARDASVLDAPYAVKVRPSDGDLFVVDTANNRVIKFIGGDFDRPVYYPDPSDIQEEEDPQISTSVSDEGTVDPKVIAYARTKTDRRLLKPMGVAFYERYVYIADAGNGRAVVFYDSGEKLQFLRAFGFFQDNGILRDITSDSQGNIYLLDSRHGTISKFKWTGEPIEFSDSVPKITGLYIPYGITVDDEGYIYVADTTNHRVLKYAQDGQLALIIGEKGKAEGKLLYPQGVAIDKEKSVLVADTENYRIEKFRADGTYVGYIGEWGWEAGQFFHNRKISIGNRDGTPVLFAADSSLNRIQIIEIDPFITIHHEPIEIITSNPFPVAADIETKLSETIIVKIKYRINDGVWRFADLNAGTDLHYDLNLNVDGLKSNHILTYRIEATIQNTTTTNFTEYYKVPVDIDPPVISNAKPDNESFYSSEAFEISADYYDVGFGIATETISLKVAGVQVTPQEKTANHIKYTANAASIPEGRQAITLSVRDKAGHETTSTWHINIDRTKPVVTLTSLRPVDFAVPLQYSANGRPIATKRMEINGSVSDAHIDHYKIESGTGTSPSAWGEVYRGNISQNKTGPLHYWNSADHQDGTTSLRIIGVDKAGNQSVPAAIVVEVDNTVPQAAVIQPYFGEVILPLNLLGGKTEVLASISEPNLKSYKIEAGEISAATLQEACSVGGQYWNTLKEQTFSPLTSGSPMQVNTNWAIEDLDVGTTRIYTMRFTVNDAYQQFRYCSMFNVGLEGIVITPIPDVDMATNKIKYDLSDSGQITVKIYRALNESKLTSAAAFTNQSYAQFIKTIVTLEDQARGINETAWDGKNSAGTEMPDSGGSNIYYYLITALNDAQVETYAFGRISKIQLPKILSFSINASSFDICYKVNKTMTAMDVEVYNPAGNLTRAFDKTSAQLTSSSGGFTYCINWDGKNRYDQKVELGTYRLTLSVSDSAGNTATSETTGNIGQAKPTLTASNATYKRTDEIRQAPTLPGNITWPNGTKITIAKRRAPTSAEISEATNAAVQNGAAAVEVLNVSRNYELARNQENKLKVFEWNGRTHNPQNIGQYVDQNTGAYEFYAFNNSDQLIGFDQRTLGSDTTPPSISLNQNTTSGTIDFTLNVSNPSDYLRNYILSVYDSDFNLMDRVAVTGNEDTWSGTSLLPIRNWAEYSRSISWTSSGKVSTLFTNGAKIEIQGEDIAGNISSRMFEIQVDVPFTADTGAIIVSDDNLAMLRIPPYSVEGGVSYDSFEIEMHNPNEPQYPSLPTGVAFLDRIYNFVPSHTQFNPERPAILRLYYELDGSGNVLLNGIPMNARESELAFYFFNEDENYWERMGGAVGIENYGTPDERHYIWSPMTHLSQYCLAKNVDNTVPVASITAPATSVQAGNLFNVLGTAHDANMDRFVLQYGKGSSPTSWIVLKESETNVSNGLLGTWDARLLAGAYTLKLSVWDKTGNVSVTANHYNFQGAGPEPPPGEEEIDATPPTLSNLSITPNIIAPGSGSSTKKQISLSYTVSENVKATINIVSKSGQIIKTLSPGDIVQAGTNSKVYSGDTDASGFAQDGSARFHIKVFDLAGNDAEGYSQYFLIDSTEPEFSDFEPAPGDTPPENRPTISVKISDMGGSGIDQSTLQVLFNNNAVPGYTYSLGTLVFTAPSDVVGGVNTVFLSVRDNAGNLGTTAWSFYGDRTPPAILGLTEIFNPFSPTESMDRKDECKISVSVEEINGFEWTLEIKDGSGDTIRTYGGNEGSDPDGGPFTISETWRGTKPWTNEDDEIQVDVMTDGFYPYTLTLVDTAGNQTVHNGIIELDDKLPIIGNFTQSNTFFSPFESTGVMDTLSFGAEFTEQSPEKLTWLVQDNHSQEAYREETALNGIPAASSPVTFSWNGRKSDNTQAPDSYYGVSLIVYDEAGNLQIKTGTVGLDNTNPVSDPGQDFSVDENSVASFDGTGSTDNLVGIETYGWDLEPDGTYETAGATATAVYPDDAVLDIGLKVVDRAGNEDTSTVRVTVLNVPPTADAGPPREIQYSDTIVFTGSHYDPGPLDTHVYDWDFGDETDHAVGDYPEYSEVSHRYFVPAATYTLLLTVTDDDDGVGMATTSVKVLKEDTILTYTGEISKQYSDIVTLKAKLDEPDDELGDLSGKTITWVIGDQNASAITDENGYAETTLQLNQIPDKYTVETDFAGDAYYLPSHDSDEFDILKENLVMFIEPVVGDYWGTKSGEHGDTRTLSIDIQDEDDERINPLGVHQSLALQLDYAPVVLDATPLSITPSEVVQGNEGLVFSIPFESEEVYTNTLSFAGNDYFNPISATSTLTIQDSHPPKVELTYPNRNNCGICRLVSGTVKIIGSANDVYADDELLPIYPPSADDFGTYKIEYAPDWDAVAFVGPSSGITTDSDTFILSSGSLTPGDKIIFGTGAGENAIYDVLVYTVTSVSGNEITISPDIQQPTIDTVGSSPDTYKDTGVWTLIDESSTAVTDDVLAEWDTTEVPEGNYTLKLTAVERERADGVTKPNISITVTNVTVVRPETDVLSKAVYGGHGNGVDEFNNPAYIAVDHTGNMFVTDRNNDRVQKITPEGFFSVLVDSGLNKPEGIAVDTPGNIYFSDSNNDRVMKIASGGALSEFASGFNKPKGVAVDLDDNIFIADRNNDTVYKYDSTGSRLLTINTAAGGDLNKPMGMAVDGAGNIYVTDRNNDRVLKYDQDGSLLLEVGTSGQGQLNKPEGIAVNEQGYIYVSDTNNSRIVKYDPLGNFVLQLGVQGNGIGQFNKPGGLALFGCDEKLYAVDQNNARIQVYGAEGLFGDQPVVISNLYNYPDPFDAVRGTTIFFNLSKDVPVELKIYDSSSALVRDLTTALVQNGFAFNADWDALDDEGSVVQGGEYTVKVIATDDGQQITKEIVIFLVN